MTINRWARYNYIIVKKNENNKKIYETTKIYVYFSGILFNLKFKKIYKTGFKFNSFKAWLTLFYEEITKMLKLWEIILIIKKKLKNYQYLLFNFTKQKIWF